MLFPIVQLIFSTSLILFSHWLIEIRVSYFYLHRAIRKYSKNFDFILQNIEYFVSPEIYIFFRTVIYWEVFSIIIDEINIQLLFTIAVIQKIP